MPAPVSVPAVAISDLWEDDMENGSNNPNRWLWDSWCTPPGPALRKITGGRLNGKTDINPAWRMRALTDVLGPCGIGWKYNITRTWTEPGVSPEVCAFVQVELMIRTSDGSWSEPIPGTGGSMLVEVERKGPVTNDEAYKMALTDALSVAMKALGVAGDVYMGMFDGKHGREEEPGDPPPAQQQRPAAAPPQQRQVPPPPAQQAAQPPAQHRPPVQGNTATRGKVQAHCPTCGGQGLWDNRNDKAGPNSPDFRCASRTCGVKHWIVDGRTGGPTPAGEAILAELGEAVPGPGDAGQYGDDIPF